MYSTKKFLLLIFKQNLSHFILLNLNKKEVIHFTLKAGAKHTKISSCLYYTIHIIYYIRKDESIDRVLSKYVIMILLEQGSKELNISFNVVQLRNYNFDL